jgi:hypothetical protein
VQQRKVKLRCARLHEKFRVSKTEGQQKASSLVRFHMEGIHNNGPNLHLGFASYAVTECTCRCSLLAVPSWRAVLSIAWLQTTRREHHAAWQRSSLAIARRWWMGSGTAVRVISAKAGEAVEQLQQLDQMRRWRRKKWRKNAADSATAWAAVCSVSWSLPVVALEPCRGVISLAGCESLRLPSLHPHLCPSTHLHVMLLYSRNLCTSACTNATNGWVGGSGAAVLHTERR